MIFKERRSIMFITESMSVSQAALVIIYWCFIAIVTYGIYDIFKGVVK